MSIAVGCQEDKGGTRQVRIVMGEFNAGITAKLTQAMVTQILLMIDLIECLAAQDREAKSS
jgi:hypothetical protein